MKKVDFNKLQAGDLVGNILKKYGIEDAESFYKFIERDDVTGCDWIRFLIEKGFLFNE